MSVQTYNSAQVASAIGISHDNFRKQFSGLHAGLFNKHLPEEGRAHTFTQSHAMTYALTRKLQERGFSGRQAFTMAVEGFTMSSDPRRSPGELYPNDMGDTFFIVYPTAGDVEPGGDCITESEITTPRAMFVYPFTQGNPGGPVEDVLVINLTTLRARVVSHLDGTFDPDAFEKAIASYKLPSADA